MMTNSGNSFQNTQMVNTGFSDFHVMIVTVLKTTFPKVKPKTLVYRDYSKFIQQDFHAELRAKIQVSNVGSYVSFENIFLMVLNKHAPLKKKKIRANHKPYVTKQLRKAIMRRSYLENKFHKDRSIGNKELYRLYKRERTFFYSNLNLNNVTDNKTFWSTVNPLFSNKGGVKDNIILVNGDKIISDDTEVAQTFNEFFKNCVNSLDISENKLLITESSAIEGSVNEALNKFENHPSIRAIRENVDVDMSFSFEEVSQDNIKQEIKYLDSKKAGTFSNIPPKQLKQTVDIICEPLMRIWNEEMVQRKDFSLRLKLADLTPIFKKLEKISVDNYRPVSILPVVSKIFERIMQKQINSYIEQYLSPYLCGYMKGCSSQYGTFQVTKVFFVSKTGKIQFFNICQV